MKRDISELYSELHPTKNGPGAIILTKGSHKKLWWICKAGHEWQAQVCGRVTGYGCKECLGLVVTSANNLQATNPILASEWHPTKNIKKPNEFLPFSNKKAWWVCSKDPSHEWIQQISIRSKGHGCPYCHSKRVDSKNSLQALRPDIAKLWHPTKNDVGPDKVLSKSGNKYWWTCENNHERECRISDLTRTDNKNIECTHCSGHTISPEYNLKALYHNLISEEWDFAKNTKLPEQYFPHSGEKVWWKCKKFGHEWEAQIAGRTSSGYGCAQCSKQDSEPERCLFEWISQFYPDTLRKQRRLLENHNLEIDIYIPSLKVGIEYCGQYYHKENIKNGNNNKHYKKYLQAKAAGIRLITIFSSEFLNHLEGVEGYLKSILHLPTESIFARKCNIVKLTSSECDEFVSKYHIQGTATTSFMYGLKYGGKLVATMGFNHKGSHVYELNRFCLDNNLRVPGGASKLLRHATSELTALGCTKIISFSDSRWSEGNLYKQLGFIQTMESEPSYYYFIQDNELHHKFNFRREAIQSKLGPMLPGETEFEAMIRFGYYRIWDCGKKKWELVL